MFIYISLFRGGMGETFLSLLAPRSLSSPPCVPLVPGLGAPRRKRRGPSPHEGHGGLAQAELMGLAVSRLARGCGSGVDELTRSGRLAALPPPGQGPPGAQA